MPMSTTHLNIKYQSGISIVTAIFLVVILALMGTGMVSLLTTSQQSISQEISSAKAYMAGRSCLQWGMYQAIYDSDPWLNNPNIITFTSGNLVNTQCSNTINVINSDGLTFFDINATASYGSVADPEFSQREMRLQFQP